MMTNLFSIFDPFTPSVILSNWMIIVISPILFLPIKYWLISPSKSATMKKSFFLGLYNHLQPATPKSPYLLLYMISLLIIISLQNLSGLLPYVFPSTSHIIMVFILANALWTASNWYSVGPNFKNTMIHMIPVGTPGPLMPFMVIIELISTNIRPHTLSIRLAANMVAGHLIISLLSSTAASLSMFTYPLLSVAHAALTLLELAVAMIQAYVFTMLITLYLAEASAS